MSMSITITRIEPIHEGDWHDKPLRWKVEGPGDELQQFTTWRNARAYAALRRKSADMQTAGARYARLPTDGRMKSPADRLTDRDITPELRASLVAHADHRICFGQAQLQRVGDRFVMTGPSGTHSLDVDATDAVRLNAHWQVFATHTANAALS